LFFRRVKKEEGEEKEGEEVKVRRIDVIMLLYLFNLLSALH
jgi:hypothetical protein